MRIETLEQQQIEAPKGQNAAIQAEATATLDIFEARLGRLEVSGAQVQH